LITGDNIERIRALNSIAERRGQTLGQMAIAWALRDPRVSSALLGARTVEQLIESLASLDNLPFSDEELTEIDAYASDGDIDIWNASSQL